MVTIVDKSKQWRHKCGCELVKEEDGWSLKETCKRHKPSYQKRADKLLRTKEKMKTRIIELKRRKESRIKKRRKKKPII